MKLAHRVMQELRRLNFSPVMNGDKVIFTYQGARYMYCDFGMDGYMSFTTNLANVEEYAPIRILSAINEVNTQLHFGKLILQDGCVLASYEYLMTDDAKMEFVILNAFSTLSFARERFFSEAGSI